MKLNILNLNIWNYNDWEKRKPKIISFIKKKCPDVIVLQEIRDDKKFNKKGHNQAKQLNEELKYPNLVFYPVTNKRKERPSQYKRYCIEGTAVLSKFPIIKTERKMLKKHKEDIYNCGNLYFQVQVKKKKIDFVAVHFSNSELTSLLHFIETLKYIEKKKINPIIVGDFNMFDFNLLKDLTGKKWISSRDFKKYISYPARKWALDYILIPKEYMFKSFICEGTKISDHRALIAEVEI
jgi:endonuclease/exonuclease/phosphatase family metal-dependent hydrolase